LVTESSEEEDGDWLLFGYVIGLEEEWGYFRYLKLRASEARSSHLWSAIFGFSRVRSTRCFVVSGRPPWVAGKERY
jgi:hypothetical protein